LFFSGSCSEELLVVATTRVNADVLAVKRRIRNYLRGGTVRVRQPKMRASIE
jgi:hypothetical protein